MGTAQEKFQDLLRELFQFDCAELDFGIYRIMNHKRDVVENFITKDLLGRVYEELAKGALAEQSQAAKDLKELRQKVLDALGEDALNAEGTLNKTYHQTKAGREYLAARSKKQPEVILDSYIISATPFDELYKCYDDGTWDRQKFKDAHIIFPAINGEYHYIKIIMDQP